MRISYKISNANIAKNTFNINNFNFNVYAAQLKKKR